MCIIAVPFFIAKLVMYLRYKKDPSLTNDSTFMQLLGIYPGMKIAPICVDIIVAFFSFILIFVYGN